MSREHGLIPVEQGYVAIGWDEMGGLSAIKPTREYDNRPPFYTD